MILLLLISLAVLLWIIQREMDAPVDEEPVSGCACPACRAAVDIDWLVCPHCQQRLRESCSCCHRGKLVTQSYCPFCGSGSERQAA